MTSFKEKVMVFLKTKNLESEFILFLADFDENNQGRFVENTTSYISRNDNYKNSGYVIKTNKGNTAKYMGDTHSLKRLLNTVGKKTFVEYYGDYDSDHYFDSIMSDGTVKLGSAKAKRSSANKIFEFGMQEEALKIIANSSRVEYWVAEKARELLKENFK